MACIYKLNGKEYSEEEFRAFLNSNFINQPKTSRVQEFQSDLFQKGRDKTDLINKDSGTLYGYSFISGEYEYEYDREYKDYAKRRKNTREQFENITKEEFEKAQLNVEFKNTSENQFLQLLNKDNNWVTFFVKSIIQDSAKKGYEKVLFPSGNTASKIEGHTTLEEFKKEKENRIKVLEKNIENHEDVNYIKKTYEGLDKDLSTVGERMIKTFETEITQLKAELDRVNGPEGFGALKPIYKFYEETVSNILNKQGYNPNLITDEYGNTWNEITLKPEFKQKISLQKVSLENQIASDELISQMQESIPLNPRLSHNIEQLLEDMANRWNLNWAYDYDMKEKGKIIDGKVLINPNLATLDTPFHEFLHPFMDALEKLNPTLYTILSNSVQSVVDTDGNSIYDRVSRDYPELNNNDLLKEAIVEAAGLAAVGKLVEKLQNKTFLDYLKVFLNQLGKLFGLHGHIELTTPFYSVVNMAMSKDLVFDFRHYAQDANQKLSKEDIDAKFNQLNENLEVIKDSHIDHNGDIKETSQ